MTEETAAEQNPTESAGNTLGKDILEAMVGELNATRTPWHQMSEADQHVAIERLRGKTKQLVAVAMRTLVQGAYPACAANLAFIRVGAAGSKGAIDIPKGALNRHELMDRVGSDVVILMVSPEQYFLEMEKVLARKQQGDLFKGPDVPQIGDDPEPELDLSTEPTDEPGPPEYESETDWVETANNPQVERNIATGEERRSTSALTDDLLANVQDVNMDSARQSLDFDETEVHAQSRQHILMALLWIDGYATGKHEDTDARPDFLRFRL